jgi:regulator of protease activity HflC (stomatin/prohibitin superfamily)
MTALIVFLVVAALVVIALVAILLDDSVVRVPTGELGLVLINGKPTGRALAPGRHLVPAFRRRLVEVYPSRELAYRAGDTAEGPLDDLERSGPIVDVVLGDRTAARVSYTVRFRLDPSDLRTVHERFGRDGIWSAVRDVSASALRTALNDPTVAADSTYGAARHALETTVGEAVGAALAEQAVHLTAFALDSVDLGRAGDTIQGAVRARLELEREQAEGEMRLARARTDAEVAGLLAGLDADMALRYREADAWRDLVTELARGTRPIPVRPIRAAEDRSIEATTAGEPTSAADADGGDEA